MEAATHNNYDQAAVWNGAAGHAWVDAQEALDRMFQPFESLLVEAVAAAPSAGRVLDIGCGAGATTLAVARSLGAGSRCVGLDISEPLTAAARARAEREHAPVAFLVADAQTYTFEPASFDVLVSRFGVMFFEDPVRAFANLRRAARHGALLRMLAWRSAAENPFMTAAERAAAPFLPSLPARRPDSPGQFGFANPDRVRSILDNSGWADVDIQPVDVPCSLPESELVRYATRLGPVGLVLHDADERTRAQVMEAVLAAFAPYVRGDEVRFTAACWMLRARNDAATCK